MSKPLVPHKLCHLGSKVLNTVPDVVPFFATGTVCTGICGIPGTISDSSPVLQKLYA